MFVTTGIIGSEHYRAHRPPVGKGHVPPRSDVKSSERIGMLWYHVDWVVYYVHGFQIEYFTLVRRRVLGNQTQLLQSRMYTKGSCPVVSIDRYWPVVAMFTAFSDVSSVHPRGVLAASQYLDVQLSRSEASALEPSLLDNLNGVEYRRSVMVTQGQRGVANPNPLK
ncbi:hypothetical protein BC835DRAFT_1309875 [Cytidiella melzeri]|nr:hypothetical protein BC835DRAFT_1309875 [Cytidiella melzeri]